MLISIPYFGQKVYCIVQMQTRVTKNNLARLFLEDHPHRIFN